MSFCSEIIIRPGIIFICFSNILRLSSNGLVQIYLNEILKITDVCAWF